MKDMTVPALLQSDGGQYDEHTLVVPHATETHIRGFIELVPDERDVFAVRDARDLFLWGGKQTNFAMLK